MMTPRTCVHTWGRSSRRWRSVRLWCRLAMGLSSAIVMMILLMVFLNHRATRESQRQNQDTAHRISVVFRGGLGNHMFQYASLVGIAQTNNLTPVIPNDSEINKIFTPWARSSRSNAQWMPQQVYIEQRGNSFEPKLTQLGNSENVILNGYFQSWRYFTSVDTNLRQQFVFHQVILAKAKELLNSVTEKFLKNSNKSVSFIGVHVRRGDIVKIPELVTFGYVVASRNYLSRSMAYFRQRLPGSAFVVASNDMTWCRTNLRGEDVFYLGADNPREVDLAALSLCNHTIITVGSFGWWAGWLAGGQVLYYQDYPRPGSKLAKLFTSKDYWYPNWIGM